MTRAVKLIIFLDKYIRYYFTNWWRIDSNIDKYKVCKGFILNNCSFIKIYLLRKLVFSMPQRLRLRLNFIVFTRFI